MDLTRLIEGLSLPSAYGGAVDAVEVHQTHISAVFLAGSLAYKIKKPVDLGFVDYSTIERRRHCCEEEVRLNRRLAPDVYLGVVPVNRQGDSVRIEGTGEVVEWAVKMRRLPDAATLSARISRRRRGDRRGRGAVAPARPLPRIGPIGARRLPPPARSRRSSRNARENFDQAARHVGLTVSRTTLDRLRDRTRLALERLRDSIESRASRGVPRDTHGDLRLDHVYWFPDRRPPDDWVVVDCIEFDARYRHADPIADIAFLAMELTLEGRSDLAGSFIEEYLRAADDEEGRGLLPFYRAYRAMVRGKVEGMKTEESEVPEADRAAARVRARALWLHALSELEEPGRRPCLVMLAGLPGTGKSTLARGLAERAGFTVIRSDMVRKKLAGRGGRAATLSDFGQDIYTPNWDDRTYAECLRRAEEIVFQAGRVLVDASFREESRRRLFLDAARRWGVAGCMLLGRADPDVVHSRLAGRRGDASDAGWAIYQEAARRWEAPEKRLARSPTKSMPVAHPSRRSAGPWTRCGRPG